MKQLRIEEAIRLELLTDQEVRQSELLDRESRMLLLIEISQIAAAVLTINQVFMPILFGVSLAVVSIFSFMNWYKLDKLERSVGKRCLELGAVELIGGKWQANK